MSFVEIYTVFSLISKDYISLIKADSSIEVTRILSEARRLGIHMSEYGKSGEIGRFYLDYVQKEVDKIGRFHSNVGASEFGTLIQILGEAGLEPQDVYMFLDYSLETRDVIVSGRFVIPNLVFATRKLSVVVPPNAGDFFETISEKFHNLVNLQRMREMVDQHLLEWHTGLNASAAAASAGGAAASAGAASAGNDVESS